VPEFKLPAYAGIPVTSHPVDVKDEDVEKVVTNMRDRQARFEEVTGRAAGKGDVVVIDYSATCDGKTMKEIAPANTELGEGKDFWVLVGDDMPLFLPGMPGKLEGIEIGGRREIEITFPSDYRVKEVAGRKALYSVTAGGLRERKLPEVNDEFAKTLGTESLDDLRQKIRENLMESGRNAERDRQRDEVIKWLLENTDLKELPQTLVEEEARRIIQDVVQENVRHGISKDEIESNRDDIFNRAAQSSTERVKLNYILGRIADEKMISVSDEEVETRIVEMAIRYKMPPQKMKAELEKRDALRSIQGNLRMEKTLDVLMAEANVTVA